MTTIKMIYAVAEVIVLIGMIPVLIAEYKRLKSRNFEDDGEKME